MATIDPNIALGYRPIQVENPVNQFAKMQELQLGQAKMQEYQRGLEEQNALRDLIKSGVDLKSPEARVKMYSISPELGIKFEKSQAELEKAGYEAKKLKGDVAEQDLKLHRERVADLAFNPSNENILAHLQDAVLRGNITQDQAKQQWAQVGGMPLDQRKQYFTQMGVNAEKRLTDLTTRRGQDLTAQVAREGHNLQYDPELQGRIAEARKVGENRATAKAALPGALQTAQEGIRLIDEMVGKPEIRDANGKVIQAATAPHPGFSDYVGATWKPGMRFIEGSNASAFELRQKQIEGKAFLEAFNALKGGGSITEKEGEKGTAAIMRMNKASNEKEYVTAARELQDVLRSGMERARSKAGETSPVAPATPAPTTSNVRAPAGAMKFLGFEEPAKK